MKRSGALSQAEFERALARIKRPGGRVIDFLRVHVRAPGRALTASLLAEAVGYPNHNAVNLQYGNLAARIGRAAGHQGANLFLLVEFAKPTSITNRQRVLIMRPAFAAALRGSGWL